MKFRSPAYSYDDVLLEPRANEMASRMDPCTRTRLTKRHWMNMPIVAANMDTVTEEDMMLAMGKLGGAAILHRFMSNEDVIEKLLHVAGYGRALSFFSIGIDQEADREFLDAIYVENLADGVCIDTAHGDCTKALELIRTIKAEYPDWDVIAGNIATGYAAQQYCNAGADAIKVGVGPGSLCTTRLVTGCGVPQLTAIIECVKGSWHDVPVIADGGIRHSGDIVKALAAGASSVMIGSLFSGTDETPGETVSQFALPPTGPARMDEQGNLKMYKRYRGMASRDAMSGWKGEDYNRTPEGESKLVECKGPVENVVNDLVMGIRSGMTYQNAKEIGDLCKNAVFIPVTPLGYHENGAHGLRQ